MPDIRMGVSKESIKSPEPVDEDVYTFRVEGFKPKPSSNKTSINYNPILRIVSGEATGAKFANKQIFENLNNGAGWVQHDFVHSLGLEMEDIGGGELAIPGKFHSATPDNVETWKYAGPIVGKTGKAMVVKSVYNNKTNNKIKYYVCTVDKCNEKYPGVTHSTNLAGV